MTSTDATPSRDVVVDATPPRFVDDPDALAEALTGVTDTIVGVDVERADAHRYFRRAALIQVGDAAACVLVDPLALDDLGALDRFLRDRLAVLHAIENDLEPMRAAGVEPSDVADTAIAAALLGLPTGLGNLLEAVLDVTLAGDKERFQRADWELRPLTPSMAAYAAGDVRWLPALWRELAARLGRAGRTDWYEQELAATVETATTDHRAWTRTRGAGRLDPSQRAVLRHLWEEREAVAREHDIAPGRLLRDAAMLDLAADPAGRPGDVVKRNQRRSRPLRRHAERLFAAQERGRAAPPEPRPAGRRWTDTERQAFDALRATRTRVARDVGIDPGLLCPSRALTQVVAEAPSHRAGMVAAAGLRPWQDEVVGDDLWEVYRDRMGTADRPRPGPDSPAGPG